MRPENDYGPGPGSAWAVVFLVVGVAITIGLLVWG